MDIGRLRGEPRMSGVNREWGRWWIKVDDETSALCTEQMGFLLGL